MNKRFKTVTSIGLLFVIIVLFVLFFHTCSMQYQKEHEVVEEPVIEEVQQPEPVEEPVVVETPPAEVVEEPPAEAPEVVEPIEEPVEEPVEEPQGPKVPEAPDLDWFVYTELYVDRIDNWDSALFEDEIDWSQFVFSDEEIVLPDGTYYAHLYVNDTSFGTIEFEQKDAQQLFKRVDLEAELNGTLATDYYFEFFSNSSDYYDLAYLETKAERVDYDSNNLLLYLYFNSSQVPVQTISMNSSTYSLLRQNYDVVGNVIIEPAKFSFESNISAFVSAQYDRDFLLSGLSASLSLSNTFSFWNITFSLPMSISYIKSAGIIPSIGNWSGYLDFPNSNLRLTFGNVGNAGFSSGSPFGFTLEKSYSFGTSSALSNQYTQTITLTEDSTVDIRVNGNSVYTKTLSLGVYRLTDFAFVQGANDIVVTIHPISMGDDTSMDQVMHFSQDYDTSLMAKGESVWRFGASIPKISQAKDAENSTAFGFVTPALPQYSRINGWTKMVNIYELGAMSVFWEQTIGLAHSYTQTHSFSFVFERNRTDSDLPGEYSATFNGTVSGILATSIGTTRATFNGTLSTAAAGRNSLSVNLSHSFVYPALKPLSLSGSYMLTSDSQTVSLNTGYSFSVKSLRLGLSFSTSYRFSNKNNLGGSGGLITKPWTANGSLSMGTSLGKHGSFSLNASINQDLVFYATASVSFSYGTSSVNSSVTTSNGQSFVGNVGLYYRPSSTSRNSFQLNFSNINLASPVNHTASATWSHSGDLFSFSVRQQANAKYTRFNTSFSINTALAFADGYFAMTNSLYGPFMIVAPQSSLKKASISVSNAIDSSASVSRKTFGNVLYTRLSMYKANNIVVFASNGSLFTSSGSFLFKATPVARQGFLARISLESSIAVSGILRHDASTPYDSYSSPIYDVTIADDGVSVANMEIDTDSYFFTDIDGRYILSDLKSGTYMIDLNVDGQWYAAFFEVPSVDKPGYVALYKDFDATELAEDSEIMQKYDVKTFDESYAGSLYLEIDQYITEEEYWDMLFQIADWEDDWEDWDDEWIDEDVDTSQYQTVENSSL
ncbi:MAG: hypothetical protein J6X41_01445 [Spirochaetales bacterium]|nr:hypothetical protein [Spirochaetales bacterium]